MIIVKRNDPILINLANRHYPRKRIKGNVGSPCRLLCMRDPFGTVGFVWSYPYDGFRADKQNGANCEMFRNEGSFKSSDLILQSEKIIKSIWNVSRFFTYVDPIEIKSANPGYCFKMAGYRFIKISGSGKHLLVKE